MQAALDTIVSEAKVVLDASPSTAVQDDLQTFYNAVVEARSQVAAVEQHRQAAWWGTSSQRSQVSGGRPGHRGMGARQLWDPAAGGLTSALG